MKRKVLVALGEFAAGAGMVVMAVARYKAIGFDAFMMFMLLSFLLFVFGFLTLTSKIITSDSVFMLFLKECFLLFCLGWSFKVQVTPVFWEPRLWYLGIGLVILVIAIVKIRAERAEHAAFVAEREALERELDERIPEIRKSICKSGIPDGFLHIGETPFCEECYNLLKLPDGKWEAFYGEHGTKTNPRVFDSIEKAAEYIKKGCSGEIQKNWKRPEDTPGNPGRD